MISSFSDIHGWFNFENYYLNFVQKASNNKPSHFLEIGTWLGKSACFLGQIIKVYNKPIHVWCVDTFKGGADGEFYKDTIRENGGTIKHIVQQNIIDLELTSQIHLIESLSTNCLDSIPVSEFDAIFIDGSHKYQDVLNDITYLWPALKPNGYMAGHDIDIEDVRRAVNKFCGDKKWWRMVDENCWEIKKYENNSDYKN